MSKPRILLSGNQKLPNYTCAVESVGGIAFASYLPTVSSDYDGLILCGGNDIDPSRFGEPTRGAMDIDHKRDEVEFALLQAFVDAQKPVLGICRGCQLINVFFGGTLIQHLDTAEDHRATQQGDSLHTVTTTENSTARQLYGATYTVNSAHHQAVSRVGNGLLVTAVNPEDDVVEAIEHASLPIFAVQWHPERLCGDLKREGAVDGAEVIRYFVDMCR